MQAGQRSNSKPLVSLTSSKGLGAESRCIIRPLFWASTRNRDELCAVYARILAAANINDGIKHHVLANQPGKIRSS